MHTIDKSHLYKEGPPSKPEFPEKLEWPIAIHDPQNPTFAAKLQKNIAALGFTAVTIYDGGLDRLSMHLGVGGAMVLLVRTPSAPTAETIRSIRFYRHNLAIGLIMDVAPIAGIDNDSWINPERVGNTDALAALLEQLEQAGRSRAERSYSWALHNYNERERRDKNKKF